METDGYEIAVNATSTMPRLPNGHLVLLLNKHALHFLGQKVIQRLSQHLFFEFKGELVAGLARMLPIQLSNRYVRSIGPKLIELAIQQQVKMRKRFVLKAQVGVVRNVDHLKLIVVDESL